MKPVLKKTIGVILILGLELVGFGFLLDNRYGRALKNKCKNSFENLKRRFRKNNNTRQK
jgi:hypothetical protein